MLGKVVVVAGAGAALLLGSRTGQQQVARLRERVRSSRSGGAGSTTVHDRRPQAAIEHRPTPPVLLPDATPVEVARAVLAEQPRT